MIQTEEALKLALDLATMHHTDDGYAELRAKVRSASKEALAQPTSGDYVQPDLSVLKHSDNCRYWDDEKFCTCGALEYHEMQYWKAKALAQPEQEPMPNVEFMRQVLSVAIVELYEHYKDDVIRVFTLDDLQTVVDLSESLRPQQVEDIYKRAWEMLAASAPAEPEARQLIEDVEQALKGKNT